MRWMLFCLASVPFVLPFRWYPDGDFFSDAIALFLALGIVIFYRGVCVSLPVLIGFAIALTIAIAGVMGGAEYIDVWLAPALMVLAGSFLLGTLQARLPVDALRDRAALTYGLALGGGISLVLALGQIFGWGWAALLIFEGASGVVANIGQRNQFSLYMLLSFLAFLSLLGRSSANLRTGFFVTVFVGFLCSVVLVQAGSRAALLMIVCAVLIASVRLYWWRDDRVSKFVLCFSLVFFLAQVASVISPSSLFMGDQVSGLARFEGAYTDSRWGEWKKAWLIFLEHPLGVGFGNYARYSFAVADAQSLVWSTPHNFLLHFLVETGVLGFSLVLSGVLIVITSAFLHLRSSDGGVFLPCAVVFVVLHNLLEYSFWYANFFILFVVLLSIFPSSGRVVNSLSTRVISVFMLSVLMVVVVRYVQLLDAVWRTGVKVPAERIIVAANVGVNPFVSWRADKVLMDNIVYGDGFEWDLLFCRLEAMAKREPLPQYLERMAFLAMARGESELAGGILRTRYSSLSDSSSYYFESAVRRAWPLAADKTIEVFKQEKADGFQEYAEYKVGYSGLCGY